MHSKKRSTNYHYKKREEENRMFKILTLDNKLIKEFKEFSQAVNEIYNSKPALYLLNFPNGRVDKYIKRDDGSMSSSIYIKK